MVEVRCSVAHHEDPGNSTYCDGLQWRIQEQLYSLARKPGRLFGYDSLKILSGRAQTKNWIGSALGDIKSYGLIASSVMIK